MTMKTDEDLLRQAAAKQRNDRRELGIDPTTARGGPLPDAPGAAAALARDGERGLGMPLQGFKEALPLEGQYRCVARWKGTRLVPDGERCTNAIPFPGMCDACARRKREIQERATIAARVAREIPAEYRDVRWENALALRSRDDAPRLQISPKRFAEIEAELRALPPDGRAVVLGFAGYGKSVIAAAWACGHLEAGVERVCFAQVRHLGDPRPHENPSHAGPPVTLAEYATIANRLVIDDLGDELHGAPKDSGIAAQRIELPRTLIADRFEAQRGFVLTTGHLREKIEEIYGTGTGRRIFEGALIIDLDDDEGPR